MARPDKIAESVLSWIIGGVFVCAGLLKLIHPVGFLADIESYRLITYRVAYFTALYLPALEIVAGIGLFWGSLRRQCAVTLLGLSILFTGALASAWVRGLDISCGCFGKSSVSANYPFLVGRDLLIIAGIVLLLILARRHRSEDALAT